MITDKLENSVNYPMGDAWAKAFEFLKTLDTNSPDGEYPIDGEAMFARVMSYETKSPEEGKFEAHKKYADIQSTLVGAEGIGVVDTRTLLETKAYDPATDVTFFETPETVTTLVNVYPGSFAFLLPQDGHMPQLAVGNAQLIKKVVVKIALTELGLTAG